MINVKYPRRGFVVEEVIEGCKTEGCTAEKFVVNSWQHYGEDTFNDLTEGCKRGEHSEGDHTEGICPKCRKPVVYKDYFVVTSDASTIKTPRDAFDYAHNVLKAPFPEGEAVISTNEYYFKKYKELFPEPIKISNPISNLISEEVITETFAALKAANIEEVTVSFSDDSDGCPPVDWIKFEFNEQGVKDLIKNKKSRKGTLIRENLRTDDEPWHLEICEYHFEEANIPNLKCTKELWNILVSFVYKEYETLDEKSGGFVVWKRNLVLLDSHRKLRDSDPSDGQNIPLFASGKYVRQYDKPNSTTMKTDELDGAALDFMVSRCSIYHEYLENVIPLRYDDDEDVWSPSTNWEQGGVYIHLNNISICYENENQWKSYISVENTSYGSTPLVSSMRCFVKSKFGVTVDIPNWVLGKELAKA